MPALAAGRVEFELNAPSPSQTAQLAQRFVARHGTWMAIDGRRIKAEPVAEEGWR